MVLLDIGTSGASTDIYNENADDGTLTSNSSVINRVLQPLS